MPKLKVKLSTACSPMETYKAYLKNKYLEKEMPNYGKWPPSISKKYVNLAVIEKERLSQTEAEEKSKALTYGDISKIMRKGDIQLADIATPDEDGVLPKFVLVEGAPGVGKTTFSWEACRKWAKGEILQDYKIVILVRLRDLSVRKATCLVDLIQYPRDPAVHQKVIEEITTTGGKGVLLLLEGYDELPAPLREEGSLFRNVINGDLFDEGTVVVTSRHWASEPFLLPHYETNRPVSKHIEILGFNRENIQDYISFMLKEEPSLLLDVTRYLELCPHIHSMMYIPLNCAIVLEMYKNCIKENSPVPTTMTKLYSSLIRSLLLRHMNDLPEYKDKCAKLTNLSKLPECIKSHFDNLAQLAYDGICNKDQHIIFTQDEIPSGLNTLGLMQSSMELYADIGSETSFNFLHLTIQEFLAAYHLLESSFDEQVQLFLGRNDHTESVLFRESFFDEQVQEIVGRNNHTELVLLRFLAGLSPKALESAISHHTHRLSKGEAVTCEDIYQMFESINITVLQKILIFKDSGYDKFSHPFQYYMLGSVIANACCSWDVHIRNSEGENILMFVNGVLSCKEGNFKSILSLHIAVGRSDLSELCRAPIVIKHLEFENGFPFHPSIGEGNRIYFRDRFSDSLVLFFGKLCKGSPLLIKHLQFSLMGFNVKVSQKIESFLMNTSSTTSFTSNYCLFGNMFNVIPGNQACNNIEKLYVRLLSKFFYEDLDDLNAVLRENKTLKVLHIFCDDDFTCSFVESLCENKTLKRLVLECVKTNDRHIDDLDSTIPLQMENISTKIITENKTLTELTIRCSPSYRRVSVASSLAKALCENRTLEKLEIGGIRFGVEGAEILASMLKNNTTLKELTLSRSILDDSEWIEIFETLSSSLSHNVTLSKLRITLPSSLQDRKEVIYACSKDSRLDSYTEDDFTFFDEEVSD